jgi:hypothetical protein
MENLPIRPNMVNAAVRSIRAFGGQYLTRPQAELLLRVWGHRHSLTEAEARSALHHFPAPDEQDMPAGVEGRPLGSRR